MCQKEKQQKQESTIISLLYLCAIVKVKWKQFNVYILRSSLVSMKWFLFEYGEYKKINNTKTNDSLSLYIYISESDSDSDSVHNVRIEWNSETLRFTNARIVIKNRWYKNKNKNKKWRKEIIRNRKKKTKTLLIFVCLLTHSFVRLFVCWFVRPFLRSFIRSFIHSFIQRNFFLYAFFLHIYYALYLSWISKDDTNNSHLNVK